MGQKIKTAALIPLRGGSKSIPLKNIKPIAGRPLCHWAFDAAVQSSVIDRVFAAVDYDVISKVVLDYGSPKIEIVGRSPETSTDTASTESVMLEFAEKYDFEYIVLIQATSPLLKFSDLDNAWKSFEKSGADSLLSVVRQKRFLWNELGDNTVSPSNYDPLARPRRQDFKGFLVENGAFYITSRERLLKTQCRLSGKIACHIMDDETYNELDEGLDWEIIENILLHKQRSK